MQVYSSALVFSPKKSIIRRLFSKEEPNWPLKPVADEDWSPCIQTLEGHGGYVNSVKFSPDQTMLASASNDKTVKLWDTTTGHCVRTLQTDGRAHSVTFSIDGITLAVASDAGIELWNATTGRCTGRLSPHGRPSSVAFSSDGAILASGSNRNVAQLWNVGKGQCTHTLSGHGAAVLSVAFSGDGSLTASASHDTTVKIWQTATGVCIKTLYHQTSVRSVVFSGNGDYVVSASFSGVKLFSVATGACFGVWKGGLMNGIAMSYDGTRLAFEHDRNGVLVWDTPREQILHILQGHDGPVTTLTFSKDGGLLASASIDASIKLWDLTIAQPREFFLRSLREAQTA
ncbi:Vegetative incompatibility protein HET-E-1 [Colletotrichum tropicale]|nr:Vegetative incompatibility protein HET-E-1 [Colletotrichum tropicale]